MNKTLRTTLIVITTLLLAIGIFFAGTMYTRLNANGFGFMMFNRNWNNDNSYRSNMMNGRGGMMDNQSGYNSPRGMMNGNNGMMGRNGGMMGNYTNANLTPLTVDQAKASAENYLTTLNNSDLQLAEVMVFDNNAYIMVKEISTGNGAFELLADSTSQTAYPEHGPNMMWNLKYGSLNHNEMMGGNGMMGNQGWNNTTPTNVSAEMTVTPTQAIEYAQAYLDANLPGATAATDPTNFYGYYTLDYEVNGKVAGMLSVNGFSGQIFLHTWHGNFIEEALVQ